MKWDALRGGLYILALCSAPHSYAHASGWSSDRKFSAREATRRLWQHGFDSYMQYAFPLDELQPLSCGGQGPDWNEPSAIHFNDVNANVSLTLIDNLDSFVVISNRTGFESAVRNVIDYVSFDVDTKPQVFEITIRALGGLLSAHLFASEEKYGFRLPWYKGELLTLAYDLGTRLLPAFETPTGIPYARINLRRGVQSGESPQTCSAGAGSLLLEFTTLSRWTGDTRFELAAKRAFSAVWNRRSPIGLLGNGINVKTGEWTDPLYSGVGAGIDSFYEYALKMYVFTGEAPYLDVWDQAYGPIMKHSRGSDGFWYRTIGMLTGNMTIQHIDSLGAFWPGLQVLAGDIESAIKGHLAYWNLWKRFSGIPETYNIMTRQPVSLGYPLRPEFIESTYLLYRATRDSFYLDIGERVLEDLTRRTKVACGLSTISNLLTSTQEDRMESFALSESLKYLFLLFDEKNLLNSDASDFVFTTEAHMLSLKLSNFMLDPLHSDSSPQWVSDQTFPTPSVAQNPLIPPPLSHDPGFFPASRGGEERQCPSYYSPNLRRPNSNYTLRTGLRGSIRDRSDFEYARVLAGISNAPERAVGMGFPEASRTPVDPAHIASSATSTPTKELAVVTEGDKRWWRSDGWCEVPVTEEYILDWVLTSNGGFVSEDWEPSADKLAVVDGGYLIRNVSGLHIQVTARVDRSGYDITQVGPYRVPSGKRVFLQDPALRPVDSHRIPSPGSPLPDHLVPDPLAPDIFLRFRFAPTEPDLSVPSPESSRRRNLHHDLVLDMIASTAVFGGNPAFPRRQGVSISSLPKHNGMRPSSPKPLLFGPESPYNGGIRLFLPEEHNLEGCEDHHPGLRYGNAPSPAEVIERDQNASTLGQEHNLGQGSRTDEPARSYSAPPASVLFVRRGSCTFFRKLVAAKAAGFAGVITWNLDEPGEHLSPSIDEDEQPYAKRKLNDVAIVVVSRDDGWRLEEYMLKSRFPVVIEVFVDAQPPPDELGPEQVYEDDDNTSEEEGMDAIAKEDLERLEKAWASSDNPRREAMSPSSSATSARPPQILFVNGYAIRNAFLI